MSQLAAVFGMDDKRGHLQGAAGDQGGRSSTHWDRGCIHRASCMLTVEQMLDLIMTDGLVDRQTDRQTDDNVNTPLNY